MRPAEARRSRRPASNVAIRHFQRSKSTAGVYHSDLSGRDYQRIQILTIAELLEEHRRPDLLLLVLPTWQRAERVEKKAAEQAALFGK